MKLFTLTPVDDAHPSWRYSTRRTAVMVTANSAKEARQIASDTFAKMASARPDQENTPDPWSLPKVVSCIENKNAVLDADQPAGIFAPKKLRFK